MSKWRKTEYKCKCECVIKRKGKEKEMVVRFNQIVTVPHCYPSVVRNTLETAIEISIGVEVEFIVTGEGTRMAVRSSMKVNRTTRTEVTSIVTRDTGAMGSDAVFELMRGATDGTSLIDFREAMSTRGGDVDVGMMRGSGSRDRRETGTRSDMRTSSRGITMTLFMTPFATIVTCAVEGGPERL